MTASDLGLIAAFIALIAWGAFVHFRHVRRTREDEEMTPEERAEDEDRRAW